MTTRRRLLAGLTTALALALPLSGAFAQTKAPAPYTPPSGTPAVTAADPAPPPALATTPSASAEAAPAGDPAAAAASLPAIIEDVQVVGPWTEGETSGIWRTIMMQVGAGEESYRFFVQRIEKTGGRQAVLSTTEIKEVSGVKGAIVGYRADEPSEGNASGLSLFFDIVRPDGEIPETYELHFQNDATYTFGPATN